MALKPYGERILVKPIEIEEKTAGGIIIPNSSKEKSNIGTIVAVSDSEKVKDFKIGQKIVFSKYSGTEFNEDNQKYIIIKIEDVLAFIE
ncbi:chaperonin Cpn10 [Methanococcus vannielii SB]|jgi:chaperonin GroES|uniref:Chaperonin Cpn10 n=1 Tax=Methanococcus vannielii (strain ATCC 35089 / DSM 1224 / JCM 13029 / OCM 148 / SB) TaxID=406327 RepID=A6UNR3_METVS|nr:co-chaperone GroES [Methanococcus vannielii]ABR54135.1 chaperonin Cpn10 [Methanococcus vannielii SB]